MIIQIAEYTLGNCSMNIYMIYLCLFYDKLMKLNIISDPYPSIVMPIELLHFYPT